MSVLNSIAALVRPGDSVKLMLTAAADGSTTCTVVPQLANVNAEDADETRRELVAALATPFQFTVAPLGDVTAELTSVIQRMREPRAGALDALTSYEAALADAAARARSATASKAKPGKEMAAPALAVDPVADAAAAAPGNAPTTAAPGEEPATGLFADC